ncbi:signal peptide peptidase SppA, partial [Salibacteraceae bacterium]|nr:signal peptide peptidase SppA [Salibacteraceae bacterium]
GGDALENGLVDEIGGLEDAIAYAAEMAELSDYDILELPKKSDPFEKFMKDFGGSMKAQVVEWVLGDEVKWLKKIDEIKKMEGIQSRMLYDIRVY